MNDSEKTLVEIEVHDDEHSLWFNTRQVLSSDLEFDLKVILGVTDVVVEEYSVCVTYARAFNVDEIAASVLAVMSLSMSVPLDDFRLDVTRLGSGNTNILSCLPDAKRFQPMLEIGLIHRRMREVERIIVISKAIGADARRRKAELRRRIRRLSVA